MTPCRKYLGNRAVNFTSRLQPIDPDAQGSAIPIYRVMDLKGELVDGGHDPKLPTEKLVKM